MPDPAVTLRDVARRAGVHPATASRALNPQTRLLVSDATAQRIADAAAALGYRPNAVARSLRTRRSHTIGVLIPDLNNPLFPPMVRGLEDRLAADGYVALIGNTDGSADRERQLFEQMRARHVDGFAVATAQRRSPLLEQAAAEGLDVVLMNRVADGSGFPSVSADNHLGARLAVGHLIGAGHRAIAHLGGPQCLSTGQIRYQGFQAAMAAAGVAVRPDLVDVRPRLHHRRGAPAGRAAAGRPARGHGGRGGERHARRRLLRGDRGRRAQLPAGHLGDRVQRHAVHGPAAAAADHGGLPALPARDRGRGPAAGPAGGPPRPGRELAPAVRLVPELVVRGSVAAPPA